MERFADPLAEMGPYVRQRPEAWGRQTELIAVEYASKHYSNQEAERTTEPSVFLVLAGSCASGRYLFVGMRVLQGLILCIMAGGGTCSSARGGDEI